MIMSIHEKFAHRLSCFLLLLLAIQVTQSLAAFTDVPPPPVRPERFNSREELKRYLQLVHEYYAIIGRPRFGRSVFERPSFGDSAAARQLLRLFDGSVNRNGNLNNNDESIIFEEYPLHNYE